ncbi:DUF4393 domain-containing protein [Pedobacter hiemivivus]|uniref:DUF4393 domain-containing protein n=1 Tax=Pedobacter hiemivivus TaxID=2530454 RepID=A0A4U1GIH5_9SPHI|nr:Abi-alpha family protein [Pedobacter hiemivivus]TKC64051.1 DUF4393 domain-containing protein [Pedobacter hiemivivus]
MGNIKNQTNNNFNVDLKEFDPLGMHPVGDSIGKSIDGVTELGLKSIEKFLSITCKPLFEELGLAFRDKISTYRLTNTIKTLEKAEGKLVYDIEKNKLAIHPRIAHQIVEHASMADDDNLQEMWAGLFASSCNKNTDDENIIFVDILKQLTASQVKLLNFVCLNGPKYLDISKLEEFRNKGFINTDRLSLPMEKIHAICGTDSYTKLHTELSAMIALGLLTMRGHPSSMLLTTFETGHGITPIPTFLLLQLFVKCQGVNLTPFKYFEPQIKLEIHEKINDYVSIDKNEALDYINQQYKVQLPYNIRIQNNEILVDRKTFTDSLTSDEKTVILKATALRRWSNFKFEENFPVKAGDKLFGYFNFQKGFTES